MVIKVRAVLARYTFRNDPLFFLKNSYLFNELSWDSCQGFPDSSVGKESAGNAGDPGSVPWVGKIPWRRERLPTLVFWPGEFRRLYSPWNRKESYTTERWGNNDSVG